MLDTSIVEKTQCCQTLRHCARRLPLSEQLRLIVKTLWKIWSTTETPYPKKALHLPTILSQAEVERLIDAASTPFHCTLLMTLYATGVRRAELTHLKVTDVDSQRMV